MPPHSFTSFEKHRSDDDEHRQHPRPAQAHSPSHPVLLAKNGAGPGQRLTPIMAPSLFNKKPT